MFTTFRNAWKIQDLRRRILVTLLILTVYRFGIAMPVPFVNVEIIAEMFQSNYQQGTMLSYMDFMSGGALSTASIFALGVQPYINSSIIMQLLAVAFPSLERLRQEGPEGQKKFNQITRIVGGVLALVLGFGYYWIVRRQTALSYGTGADLFAQIFTAAVIIVTFTAGAMMVMWLGEQIDQKGIGNGISMIIFVGIVSRFASIGLTTKTLLTYAAAGQYRIYIFLPIVALLTIAAMVLIIVLNAAERRVPVQYAKRVVGRKMYGGQSTHIPIKVNMSGVMPVIFASALTSIPGTILSLVPNITEEAHPFWFAVKNEFGTQGWIYAVIYALLIVAFNYFYVTISYNPLQIANDIKKNNGAIPGIRPGKPTSDFLARIVSRITLIGALFLVIIAVGPIIISKLTGIPVQMGGTSLIIVVGVALDTARSLESFMLMRHHKGFLE